MATFLPRGQSALEMTAMQSVLWRLSWCRQVGARWLEQVARWEKLVVKGNEAEDAGVGKVYNSLRTDVEYIGKCCEQTVRMGCRGGQVCVTVVWTRVDEGIK